MTSAVSEGPAARKTPSEAEAPGPVSWVPHALAAAAVLAGLLQRIWILSDPALGVVDSDEAVVGLMAKAFLDGDPSLFYWGQDYGGALEPLLTAAVFLFTGASPLALKAVPLALSALAAVLVWRIGIRIGGPAHGALAGLAFWVWPGAFVWWSTKARGFYWVVMVCGLIVVLLALVVAKRVRAGGIGGRQFWIAATALGFAAGLGWYASPHIVLLSLPAVGWLIAVAPRVLAATPAAFGGFLVGSLPWWVANLRSGWGSLVTPVVADRQYSYLGRLWRILWDGPPMLLGARVPYEESWIVAGPLVFVGLAALTIAGAVALARRGWAQPGGLVVVTLLVYPVIAAISPLSWYIGEGRYLLFAAPFVVVAITTPFARRPLTVGAALVGVLALSSTVVLAQGRDVPGAYAPDVPIPADASAMIDLLDVLGVQTAEAPYWIAYRITFETDERVIVRSFELVRHEPYQEATAGGVDARILVAGSALDARNQAEFDAAGIAYDRYEVGGFVVFKFRAPPE